MTLPAGVEPPPPLGLIALGPGFYFEEWGFGTLPTTLLWHAKTKAANRPPTLHAYMATHHCDRRTTDRPRCRRGLPSVPGRGPEWGGSCTGGEWLFCEDDASRRGCPQATIKTDLLRVNRSQF